ncbi:cobalt ECF transporter T component CbiQ [Aphanothece sacrum]|uniref:Cobalt ABC transporter, inner membrane subunit CbiQ n=1 Tax=Aphanothece sacrum FPU1 TaxID=1920663 RepID=A0A401IG80_APHSA|nr:cobalt ECF transporter T component CbiQ [Aphanothece sacrum]GBF80293.1 cobalt ABC transporter, inner membrane subunit CbiQ [Aphanothece sacrum FPU1]GBF83699.1 cobalt ABC transporter, inner membrane subunit CbiQ [Aphanothece sacrum FPU3]
MKNSSSYPQTPWHILASQTRLLCTLISVFAIALTPNGKWLSWIIYGIGLLILILISRVSFRQLLSKVMIEFAFVGVVLLGTLFRREGEVILSWGIIQITTTGVMILGSVTIKVILSLFALNILIITTSIPQIFQGLLILKIPPLLVAIMASMYRYIGVLIEEVTTMKRAAMSRNLMINRGTIRYVMGNGIGSLFIRTYDRGERIHQAMLARGYQGIPPVQEFPGYKAKDKMALILTSIIIILGQIS